MNKKNYRLLSTNVISFAYKAHDGFHSELDLFKKNNHFIILRLHLLKKQHFHLKAT